MYNINLVKDKVAAVVNVIEGNNAPVFKLLRNHLFHKLAILCSLSLFLTILLTPQIPFQSQEYEVGSIAATNIKADRDFIVDNKAATDQRKMEAANEIPSVYDYDGDVAHRIQISLTNAFSQIEASSRDKIYGSQKTEKEVLQHIKKDFESTLGLSLSEEEFIILYQNNFSIQIANNISRLIASAYKIGMITNVTFLQQEKDKGIIIRDIKNQSEKQTGTLTEIRHIRDVETSLLKAADKIIGMERTDLRKVSLSIAVKLLQPNLVYNKNATELKKQDAIKDVKPVFFKIQKNEMIVREGEKITAPVLDKLDSFYRIKGEKRLSKFLIFIGMFCIIASLGMMFYLPAKQLLKSENKDIIFLSATALLQIIIVKAGIFVSEAVSETLPLIPETVFIYAIPFTVGAMLVSLLTNRNLALIMAIFSSIIVTFLFDSKISLFLFSFLGSVVASHVIIDCKKRSAFFKVGFLLGLVNASAVVFLGLLYDNIFTINTLISLILGFLGGIVSAFLVSGLSPVFETIFQYTTDIKLLELANLNQPIFQQMIMEAPGTYHHSIIVASMVEAASETIGANSLLTKVSAYYHDIGKMRKPQYFIENQQNGENKHDKITPKMSALVIISHVKEGCDMAQKVKLGAEITDIIRQHHGTSLVSFFYEKAKKDKDPSIRSLPEVDFRYPGPKPQTREAGLVLLGDVVEASSRTLSNPTPSRIKALVRERIERVFTDGQLDESELTLHDLNKIAESFTMIINGIFHHRIDYPEPVIRESNGNKKESGNGIIDKKPTKKNKGRAAAASAVGE